MRASGKDGSGVVEVAAGTQVPKEVTSGRARPRGPPSSSLTGWFQLSPASGVRPPALGLAGRGAAFRRGSPAVDAYLGVGIRSLVCEESEFPKTEGRGKSAARRAGKLATVLPRGA